MNRKIDRFLLGVLWLLSGTLAASFWFNAQFDFNIFLSTHWEFLAQLQATGEKIIPLFYISIIVIVFLIIFGLYLIVRPRFRKINFQKIDNAKPVESKIKTNTPDNEIKPEETAPATSYKRPPRLSIPKNIKAPPPLTTNTGTTNPAPENKPVPPTSEQNASFPEIEEAFSNAGYTVKKPTRIGTFNPALFAIGSDEVLWIGGIDIKPQTLNEAIDKLNSIFTQTLQDIKINIKSFIIGKESDDFSDLGETNKFASIKSLCNYISNNKNRTLADSEKEDFNAYSEYVDTVADYFKKS